MGNQDLLVEVRERVAWLTINRPQAMNALMVGTIAHLVDLLADLAGREDIGCLVIRGAGDRAFCAGRDIREFGQRMAERNEHDVDRVASLMSTIATFPVPTIAAVKGYVRGGGYWLAANCDIVVAAEDATFALPQINIGVFPTELIPSIMRRAGRSKVLEMMLTADALGAHEAKEIGLVDRLLPVEGFWDAVQQLAQRIAGRDRQAVRAGKEALALLLDLDLVRNVSLAKLPVLMQFMTRKPESPSGAVAEHSG